MVIEEATVSLNEQVEIFVEVGEQTKEFIQKLHFNVLDQQISGIF